MVASRGEGHATTQTTLLASVDRTPPSQKRATSPSSLNGE